MPPDRERQLDGVQANEKRVDRYLIIVARDRLNLFQQLRERHGHEATVILDHRKTPRPSTRASGLWHTDLQQDGYVLVETELRNPH